MAGFIMLFPKMVKAVVSFNVNIFWKAVLWTVAIASLPVRVLTALQRERMLEQHLHEIQFELETLVWDRNELEDHLQAAVRESRIMESMLIELEGEHDKAIARIELLEGELQDLKDENLRLKEVQGKAASSYRGHDATNKDKSLNTVDDNHVVPYSIASWVSNYKGSGISFQELMVNREVWEGKSKSTTEMINFLKAGPAPSGSVEVFSPGVQNLEVDTVIEQRKEVALSQTLFSAILSLLVGMIVWEAEDPCMPLVVALFTVVGMSLQSVVQFFFSIKNKPASDAVALLSFNWFIVGTLSYPALPKVTRMLAPLTLSLVDRIASWLGISFN
ncbi:hypothetical protein ES319_A08G158500v1 [Gossypium barbadense]|uniref:Uncharacterized protein n=2 Tax=Gossypium TaxID=3633 RepID=A0A2P5YT73_GOSBA|nr:hypothetical protein ES319_A08G158500v1 [Gossypium barbadense]KAB2070487.1 hypothetical protein ES319_A08G158500v1 [Gossypium barbadense]PPS18798.1 hypothetical protein GOBAR_AA01768 [Gossypium barbadense]TYH06694.1 hypothetical protein ES288_A08G174300v1 [Gossypium darwinii]TYH06695.1 hypothetical protein ES288_A08G174300v1 [Gossypium darwinii]